jgi:hypothetical protein
MAKLRVSASIIADLAGAEEKTAFQLMEAITQRTLNPYDIDARN